MSTTPLVKWVGGKTQLLGKIIPLVKKAAAAEDNNVRYCEAFAGGGSIFIKLLNELDDPDEDFDPQSIHINDVNVGLVALYKSVKDNPKKFMKTVDKYAKVYDEAPTVEYSKRHNFTKEYDISKRATTYKSKGKQCIFYYYRALYNAGQLTDVERAALFLFLNKTCFRGLYREGKNGFNVPWGSYINPTFYKRENVMRMSEFMNDNDVQFYNLDYKEFMLKMRQEAKENGEHIIAYFDPPYYPLNKKSFATYSKDGFIEEHDKLAMLCKELDSDGHTFIHSNSYCDYNVEAYADYKTEKLLCKRLINSKNPGDKDYEILVYNFE